MRHVLLGLALIGCGSGGGGGGGDDDTSGGSPDAPSAEIDAATIDAEPLPPPPATWQEHWFEHDQLLELMAYDDHAAIYVDADVDRAEAAWLLPFVSDMWRYTKETYGLAGADRLFSIHHQGRYSGGHPSTHFDDSHDFRNVSDCGPGPWGPGAVDLPSHETAHVVEASAFGVHGSPAFGIWGDSKWAEIYQYDLYVALGMTEDAERVRANFDDNTDDFPRAGTHWFRDWFYPLWHDHGGAQVMSRYFELLSQHFPKNGQDYARDMNMGEYVHFTSGAAGVDLEAQAVAAFGDAWLAELAAARAEFPQITY
jgi:hypothetical protein